MTDQARWVSTVEICSQITSLRIVPFTSAGTIVAPVCYFTEFAWIADSKGAVACTNGKFGCQCTYAKDTNETTETFVLLAFLVLSVLAAIVRCSCICRAQGRGEQWHSALPSAKVVAMIGVAASVGAWDLEEFGDTTWFPIDGEGAVAGFVASTAAISAVGFFIFDFIGARDGDIRIVQAINVSAAAFAGLSFLAQSALRPRPSWAVIGYGILVGGCVLGSSLLASVVWTVVAKRDDYGPVGGLLESARGRPSTLMLGCLQDTAVVLAEALLLYQSIFTLCSAS